MYEIGKVSTNTDMKPMRQHQRRTDPDAPHQRASHVIAHAQSREFTVLRRAPQLTGDPEHVVCAGSDAVAHFFQEADALAYANWRNAYVP